MIDALAAALAQSRAQPFSHPIREPIGDELPMQPRVAARAVAIVAKDQTVLPDTHLAHEVEVVDRHQLVKFAVETQQRRMPRRRKQALLHERQLAEPRGQRLRIARRIQTHDSGKRDSSTRWERTQVCGLEGMMDRAAVIHHSRKARLQKCDLDRPMTAEAQTEAPDQIRVDRAMRPYRVDRRQIDSLGVR